MAEDSSQQSWNELLLGAIEAQDLELIAEALSHGADARACVGEYGMVSAAVMTGNADVVRTILAAGGDPNGHDSDDAFAGHTALTWGASGGCSAIVRMLVNAGARVEQERPADGSTSVHAAAEDGNVEILKLLLEEAGGRSALNGFDYISRTPLMCAVDGNHLEAARLLIAAGSEVNVHDEDRIGNTALRDAAGSGSVEMVELLLKAGADPRIEGWMRLSANHVAASRQGPSGERVRKLLSDWRDR